MIAAFQNLFPEPRGMILVIASVWIGLSLAERRASLNQISKDDLNSLTFACLLGYIIGGRVFYIGAHIREFAQSPLSVFSPNPSLFDSISAFAVALLIGFIYGQRKKLSLWSTLDALTPLFAALAIGVCLWNLASNAILGKATELPWGMVLRGETRHPVLMYELIASLLTFTLVWFKKHDPRYGILFLTFAAWSASARLALESFRAQSVFIVNGVRLEQVVSWLVLAATFYLLEKRILSNG